MVSQAVSGSDSSLTDILTLVAAGIAALAGVINIVFAFFLELKKETRNSIRSQIDQEMLIIANLFHQITATSIVLSKTEFRSENWKTWSQRSRKAVAQFKEARPKLRYVLYGIYEDLRVISRAPNWIESIQAHNSNGAIEVAEASNKFIKYLDIIIMDCYKKGRHPNKKQILNSHVLSNNIIQTANKYFKSKIEIDYFLTGNS